MEGCSIFTARGGRGKTVPSAIRLPLSMMYSNVVIAVFIADMSADIYPSEWLQLN